MLANTVITGTAATAFATLGAGVGFALYLVKSRALHAELKVKAAELAEKCRLETAAATEAAQQTAAADLARIRATLDGEASQRRVEFERERTFADTRRDEIDGRLTEREVAVTRQFERFSTRETELRGLEARLDADRTVLETDRRNLRQLLVERRAALEQVSGLNALEARTQLLQDVEREASKDAADLSRHLLEKARQGTEEQARRIVGLAIQRYAGKHTFETTTATVALTGDDMKGRIIGRDGRNIRAFENSTGITVLVDDTPNAVVLSGFDPVRREIARQSMERLILDGRIHPTRIEEVVTAVTQEMDVFILRTGEDAVHRAGQPPLHQEIVTLLGRLHFRHSFSQNVLQHSIEVAHLCGLMAAELGADPATARRAGLLHDVGKALSHELEGPHALVGADFVRRFGENQIISNAVAAHHDEVPHESIYGILVSAADAISAARPGGRSETMTTYLRRIEQLEQIALNCEGVEKAFAVQAGRELRVIVRPEQLDDIQSLKLARDLARRIEDELAYPGQIRVTVVRETRCVEYAK